MNENPRMLVAICLEIFSIANRANMLPNMLVQMLANMLARVVGALYLFLHRPDSIIIFIKS